MSALLGSLTDLGAHYAPYGWFAGVWSLPLAAACASGIAVRVGGTGVASKGNATAGGTGVSVTWRTVVPAIGLALFVTVYAFLILYHQDLIGLDYAQLTARRFVGVPIWPDNGRFFPLGLQEYNILGLFGSSPMLYYAFSIVELLVVLAFVFRLLEGTPVWFRCAVAAFTMMLPGFVHSFFGLVYPERDMVLWLTLWVLCLQWFARTGSRTAYCGALIAAQFALYYKETAFVLIGGFAGFRLTLAVWRARGAWGSGGFARFAKDHLLELAHLALCAVFLLVYVVVIARHVKASYVSPSNSGAIGAALLGYIRAEPVVDLLAVVFAWRVALAALGRRTLDALWDALAAGALAYALAYIKLGIVRDYYFLPSDVIGVVYLARLAHNGLRAQPRLAIAGVALVVAWAFQQNVSNAAFEVIARQEFVDGNAAVASFVEHYAAAHGQSEVSLFFPQTGGFQLMEFSAFLGHRGLHADVGGRPELSSTVRFVVRSPHRYPDDRCHPSQELRCRFALAPLSSDLVVFLPGRSVPAIELDSLRSARSDVFHHRSEPTYVQRILLALAPKDRLSDRPTMEAFVFGH